MKVAHLSDLHWSAERNATP